MAWAATDRVYTLLGMCTARGCSTFSISPPLPSFLPSFLFSLFPLARNRAWEDRTRGGSRILIGCLGATAWTARSSLLEILILLQARLELERESFSDREYKVES